MLISYAHPLSIFNGLDIFRVICLVLVLRIDPFVIPRQTLCGAKLSAMRKGIPQTQKSFLGDRVEKKR